MINADGANCCLILYFRVEYSRELPPSAFPLMNAPRFDVAVASDMSVDLILTGNVRPRFGQVEQIIDDYQLELGGSANIFACQMAKLGARTAVLGRIGADAFGELALKRLQECGVDCSLVQVDTSLRTGLGVTLAEPSDRAILTFEGSITAVLAEDLPKQPAELCQHWHIASFYLMKQLCAAWGDFLQRAKKAGVTTSLDPNWDPANRWEGVQEILPLIDVFLPNEAEAAALTGELDALAAARALSKAGPIVVVKRGDRGASAVHGDEVWELDLAHSTEEPIYAVDTVGAGDNFDAGFLRAWMLGVDIKECLELGHRCAVASLRAAGGIEGQLIGAR